MGNVLQHNMMTSGAASILHFFDVQGIVGRVRMSALAKYLDCTSLHCGVLLLVADVDAYCI